MTPPNILMFHRVEVERNIQINKLYFKRGMVHHINTVSHIIDRYINDGYQFGSIGECCMDNRFFHLSFDDGFKEHFIVARILKDKYNLLSAHITFSINIGNSFSQDYTGMDVIYEIILNKKVEKLEKFLNQKLRKSNQQADITQIKSIIACLPPDELKRLSDDFRELKERLIHTFLNEREVRELSTLFNIASHGITHRFLTCCQEESRKEIFMSKKLLEEKTEKKIEIFCYPEGKNDAVIQKCCENAGYKLAFSIRHENRNDYCIGRKIV